MSDCQCEPSPEWLVRMLYQIYLSLVIIAASKILSLVFDDFSSRIHTFSLSRISPICYQSRDFTYKQFLFVTLRFLRHNLICQKNSKPRRHLHDVLPADYSASLSS